MINMFRRLTAKEWSMIALSTVFICLAVWMDLKTPEYLSDITTLLAKEGTKVSDIMEPGSKMLLQESLPALRCDFEERFSIK